jgi:CubicO group peptidase (beta-lactamase class C family)
VYKAFPEERNVLAMWEGLAMETTSRKVLIAVAVVFLLAPASTLTLAIDAQADRMENAFTEWVGKHSVESANLVIVRDGAILGTVGRGRLATSRPVGVASLSKAITGVCVVKLVETHKLQFDADLGAVLVGRFKRHPPTGPTRSDHHHRPIAHPH